MRVRFQFNDKVKEINNFTSKNIPEVEEYFYNPSTGRNHFDSVIFYDYVEAMKLSDQKNGTQKQSGFAPSIHITLD
jgi:hypothetical protein